MLHIFCSCQKILWSQVKKLSTEINLTPMSLKRYKSPLLMHLLSAVRECILPCWRKMQHFWDCGFLRLFEIWTMEELIAAINNKEQNIINVGSTGLPLLSLQIPKPYYHLLGKAWPIQDNVGTMSPWLGTFPQHSSLPPYLSLPMVPLPHLFFSSPFFSFFRYC